MITLERNSQKKLKNSYSKHLRRFSLLLITAMLLQSFALFGVVRGEVMSELTVTVINKNRVKLQWTDNYSDEKNYIVEKRIDNGSFMKISRGANTEEYIDSSVNPNHTYTYRIKVVDSGNNTLEYTDEITFCTTDVDKPNSLKVLYQYQVIAQIYSKGG